MKVKFYSALIAMMTSCYSINAQWQTMYLPSQYWPTTDVKSYNNQLYAGTNSGVYSSADNGATWTDLTQGFASSSSSSFRELAFTSTGNIYVRTTTNSIVRSMDGGTTWGYDTAGIGFGGIQAIYYDSNSDRVFIGKGALYYKTPSDASWTKVTSTEFGSGISPVQITGKGTKLFVIDVTSYIYESSDNGNTWTKKIGTGLPQSGSSDGASKFISINNDLYLGVTGVWKSSDDGDTWVKIDTGFYLLYNLWVDTRCLYYDGSTLYASVGGKHTYSSPDIGTTWTEMEYADNHFISMVRHNNTLYGAGLGKDSIYVYQGESGVGVNELTENTSINLYPNPFSSKAYLQIPGDVIYSGFELYNSIGAMVTRIPVEGNSLIIERGSLAKGIYFYKLINPSSSSISRTGKLIIE